MDYPLINGHRYSYSSIELSFGSHRFYGHREISYNQELEPGEARGASSQILGRTRGELRAEASLVTYIEEWEEILKTMGDGYYEKVFDIVVSYAEEGRPLVTDILRGCRIRRVEYSHSAGNEPLTVRLELQPLWIEHNRKKPLRKMLPS